MTVQDNSQFLKAIFGPDWGEAHITGFAEDPTALQGLGLRHYWLSRPARRFLASLTGKGKNGYFVVSLFDGTRRRKEDFRGFYVLVIDDVDEKVPAGTVLALLGEPTYRLRTSAGSAQWGYVLTAPELDMDRAMALVDGAVAVLAGNKDPGMKGVTRYARLPVGVNSKAKYGPGGYETRLEAWHPDRTFAIADLAAALGVDLDKPRGAGAGGTGKGVNLNAMAGGAARDFYLRALEELGMLRGRDTSGKQDAWLVACPFDDEHASGPVDGADGGTKYFDDGGWHCHHGSCEHRRVEDYQAKMRELLAERRPDLRIGDLEFDDGLDPEQDPVCASLIEAARQARDVLDVEQDFRDDIVFVAGWDRYWSCRQRIAMTRAALNTAYGHALREPIARYSKRLFDAQVKAAEAAGYPPPKKPPAVSPEMFWRADDAAMIVSSLTYDPAEARIVQEPGGAKKLNTYRPPIRPDWVTRRGRLVGRDVKPWLRLVWDVAGWDRRVFGLILDWLALAVAAPHLRAGWHLVLIGNQGIGKDLMLVPVLDPGVGPGNWAPLTSQHLTARFNGFLASRLIVMGEMRQTSRGTASAHDQYNMVKAYLGNRPERVTVERKGVDPYEMPNRTMWIFTSNEDVPLTLEDDDRRLFVVNTRERVFRRAGDWYGEIADWLDDRANAALCAEWLHRRWAKMSDARRKALLGKAPATAAKAALVDAGKDAVTAWVAEQIATGAWTADLITVPEVMHRIKTAASAGTEGLPPSVQVPTAHRAGRMLRDLGAVKVGGGNPVWVTTAGGTERRERVWAVRNADRYADWDLGALAGAYADQHGRDRPAGAGAGVGKVVDLEARRKSADYPF